jgi:hypothetical protein
MDLSKTTEIKLLYRKQRQFSIYPKNNNRRAVMAEGENLVVKLSESVEIGERSLQPLFGMNP